MWEEHWPALELFLAMRTQWRVVASMAGERRQGIDYNALYGHPKYARLDYDAQDTLLAQIQHIEAGALAVMSEQSHLAEQDVEERQQVTELVQHSVELNYHREEQARINVRELMNVVDLPHGYGDGTFVA
ncbi:DUF1799 domain-containing protein [Vreelandella populi]|uniref:DUF1799 domain-containing protein n=1 Tax=Vreelandella populi TaxID=2498858 RepID=UPI00163BD007|nr:DUF1799 domain-containing protein [Halomonas populi]